MNKYILDKKSNKKYFVTGVVILILFTFTMLIYLLPHSNSALLENDVEVQPNTALNYYLTVSYDGVDRSGVSSSDTVTADINSDYIFVRDIIPYGLTFNGFVTTGDGTIGAIERGTGNACPGRVEDDTNEADINTGVWNADKTEYTYHGLHYNAKTREVSFKVKNLKAGCELVVGIKTMTPVSVDDPATYATETRRDFYNYGVARENNLVSVSNTVHAWMGALPIYGYYKVIYQYSGDVPSNAPILPIEMSYPYNSKVSVALEPYVEGYTFSGWQNSDVTISNNSFTMPYKDVIFTGTFTKDESHKHNVKYKIEGIVPSGYVIPMEKNYYYNYTVKLDSLKTGDVVNGYRFLGWTSDEVDIDGKRDFIMPDNDVVIVGRFEDASYSVNYNFYDAILPPNSENYLPQSETFKPGEIVKLTDINNEPAGYEFSGWYKEDNFVMPEEDVEVYGEWNLATGVISPKIKKEIVNDKTYYQVGEKVVYKITITNTSDLPITDVIVQENNDKAYFIEGTGYEVVSPQYIRINSIPANGSLVAYAEYDVTSLDSGTIENVVKILGATNSDNYELDSNSDYTAKVEFKVKPKVKICKNVAKLNNNDDKFQFNVKGNNYETWLALEKDECGVVYLEPGAYSITEVVGQDYTLTKVEGAITSNGASLNVELGHNYEITFTNKYQKYGFFHSYGRVENKINDAFDIIRRKS